MAAGLALLLALAAASLVVAAADDSASAVPTATLSPVSISTSSPSPAPFSQSAASDAGLTATQAGAAIDSFNKAFYVEENGIAYYRKTTAGGRAAFWTQAEMIEMMEDAYMASGKPVYKHVVNALTKGFVAKYGTLWTGYRSNDDLIWMVTASLRAYRITGNTAYRTMARRNFDAVYARAWSNDFGGGLWWQTDRTTKNTCVNAPAAIAAIRLYRTVHDPSYLAKAKRLYAWVRDHLYDTGSGSVLDHVSHDADGAVVIDPSNYTYNQGTFIGAADLLYQTTGDVTYFNDAIRALDYTRDNLTTTGILKNEGRGSSGGGFKGIFARWAMRFTRDNQITSYDPWLRLNATTAWANRNAHNLMDQNWLLPTAPDDLYSFDCSSAVVMMQILRFGAPPATPSPTPPATPSPTPPATPSP